MNTRSVLAPRHLWLDGVVVVTLLALINLLVSRTDPGWLRLNPSPYLLVPLLMGGRYGFGPGVTAAVITVLGIALVRTAMGFAPSVATELHAHALTWMFMVIIGGVAGEIWLYFRRRIEQLEATTETLGAKLRQLDADAVILREAKDELDRVTAARDGEISSLDAELRRLYASSVGELPQDILSLLKRQARVTDAALYRVDAVWNSGTELERMGLVGSDEALPEKLVVSSQVIVEQALSVGSLVTLPEILTDNRPNDDSYLMVAPLPGADGRAKALLVVAEMPFIAFNASAADLVDLVCGWSGGVLELSEGAEGRYRIVAGREAQKIFFDSHFLHLVELAFQSARRHRLPSAIVELALPAESVERQPEFERIVLGAVRGGDFVNHPAKPYPVLRILLPLAGERGTDIFVERCSRFCERHGVDRAALRVRRVDLSSVQSAEDALSPFSDQDPSSRA